MGTAIGAAAKRPPILDKINRKLPQGAETDEAVARKHVCNSVWCPNGCYKRFHLARHYARLIQMPWQETRMVTLTLDRDIVGEGADAYLFAREHKIISRFFVRLRRLGVKIIDWAGQMEFHRDGTPHWHLLVRTENGRMIGQANIHKAWPWARIIHEEYFKNERHYNKTVGYFGKAGYFHKGKKYQTILPDYFKSDYFRGKRIMRFISARRPAENRRDHQPPKAEPKKSETNTAVKLTVCGEFTHIWYFACDSTGFPGGDLRHCDCLQVPYKQFIEQCPGDHVPGLGYVFTLSGDPPGPCPF